MSIFSSHLQVERGAGNEKGRTAETNKFNNSLTPFSIPTINIHETVPLAPIHDLLQTEVVCGCYIGNCAETAQLQPTELCLETYLCIFSVNVELMNASFGF